MSADRRRTGPDALRTDFLLCAAGEEPPRHGTVGPSGTAPPVTQGGRSRPPGRT